MSAIVTLIKKSVFGQSAENGYWLFSKIPPAVIKKMENGSFCQTIRYVAEHSAFYRRKFAKLNIDPTRVRVPQDLGDFFTTAEDIRNHVEEFVCQRPDTAFETTGTVSKRPKRVYYSREEVSEAGWAGAIGLYGLGIRKEDRIASAFDYSFWVSGPVLHASCGVLGCFHVEAGRLDPNEFYDRLHDYGITVIVGDPSWMVGLAEVAAKRGPWPVKLLLGGGENLTEESRKFVEDVWKTDFLLSYGQTEAFGALGIESRAKNGLHVNEFHNRFEIVNPDSDGYGELIYTTLNRRVMPLVRYRSGDITRFLEGPSGSNLPGARISKLKGRVDEWTPTAMGNLAPWMFEPVFSKLEGITPDWQITVEREGTKDLIRFHFEAKDNGLNEVGFREYLVNRLDQDLAEPFRGGFRMGLFKVETQIHARGELRPGRKLRRILDLRKF